MEKASKVVINTETGEKILTELTAEEIAQELEIQKATAQKLAEEEAAKAALEIKKQEVLAKLGLTAEEVSALLA